ncbi:MAG: DUF3098 domain-containing protein [Fulvivirga sp.]|uniref:DUF3098 domain-containing protein n=1 Tax=Fulvivirga sp. TaxID=1931237 RepID=UPI0032EB3E0B
MEKNNKMPFGSQNYKLMLLGISLLVIGFIVMSSDSEPFGFGFLGLTLGPILVFIGFLIEIAAILYSPKK